MWDMEDDSHYQEYLNEHGGKGQPEVFRRGGLDHLTADTWVVQNRLFDIELPWFRKNITGSKPFKDWRKNTSTGQETYQSMLGLGEKKRSFTLTSYTDYNPQEPLSGDERYWNVHWVLFCDAKSRNFGIHYSIPNAPFIALIFDIRPEVWEARKGVFDLCQLKAIINCPFADDLHKLDRSKYSIEDQRIIQHLQGKVIINPYQYTPWSTMRQKIVEEMINFMSPEKIDFIARHVSGKAEIARVRSQEEEAWEALGRIVDLLHDRAAPV